ncbi:ThiF family adenylyltransferase [Virgibacillus halodenitrificans]|uniref:ThiF family adenylyltransferase n=1 Tax=Virgibacillus halodenitrificans TaxID=1482 RepID=UPI000EF54EF4|nr:ThiF family adenylyltransferase [Virgibacillus halodenitrificans]
MGRMIVDFLNNSFSRRGNVFPHIVQIGVGGTGGYLVQQISQMMSIFGIQGKYVIADADIAEEKNLKNQLFIPNDIGKPKAEVLSKRYRAAYQTDISSYSTKYVEDVKTIENLFNNDYLGGHSYNTVYLPILISCVDNNFSRKIFHQYFKETEGNLLYLDVGNESVSLPDDPNKPMEQWTEGEIDSYKNSGYTGQVVAGLKWKNKVITDPIASLFPDILEDNDDIAPSSISCGDIVVSEPQRLITNRYAAQCVSTYLNEIFSVGTLSNHITFFHAMRGYMRTEPIKAKEKESQEELVG